MSASAWTASRAPRYRAAYGRSVRPGLRADGKIVVCGMAFDGEGKMLIARFLPDGSYDNTFNSTGYVLVPIDDYAVAYDVAIRPDGRIVVANCTETNSNASLALAQLDTNSLGSGLRHQRRGDHQVGYSWERINGFTLDPDGALISAGSVGTGFDFDTFDAIAVRYLIDGTPDASFGSGGTVIVDHSGAGDGAYDATLQSDGKITRVRQRRCFGPRPVH
ncbi:MAG: hypothetical protein R2818_04420 [Flavobacteriales bacterium]